MPLSRAEKIARLTAAVQTLTAETSHESLAGGQPPGTEGVAAVESFDVNDKADTGLQKLLDGRGHELSDDELYAQEAIVMATGRPAAFIRNGSYDKLDAPWTNLNATAVRKRLEPLFPAIGRIELPTNPRLPYAGTGFVVGPGLLMTNRHVAVLFTGGLGDRGLVYRPGDATVQFRRQKGDPSPDPTKALTVKKVELIHPYWDMALLRVDGLDGVKPLNLSVDRPEDLVDRDVAAVGYPAFDPRNDATVQNRIFGGEYEVKRFMPGKLRVRDSIQSFETTVSAATHDGSTLGGASGSAILDVGTGRVVGLHFAGVYLKANYAVPTFELARDPRVVAAGLNFVGKVPPTGDFDAAWKRARDQFPGTEGPSPSLPPSPPPPPPAAGSTTTVTIPIQVRVTVEVGGAAAADTPAGEAAKR